MRLVTRSWWLWAALGAVAVACGGDDEPSPDAPHAGAAGKGSAGRAGGAGTLGASAGAGSPSDGGAGQVGQGGSSGRGGASGKAGTGASSGAGEAGAGDGRGGTSAASGGSAGSEAGTAGVVEPPSYPEELSDTGLYSAIEQETLADGVQEYHPAYELWSDGATKRRWVKLPAGATIDTSDMDFWQYPTGTKLWKEFSVGGERIETRMLHKQPGGWAMVAYLWNDAQTEATAVPNGEPNAHGTMHDVPSRGMCGTCHGKMKDDVLGFTALQLSHDEGGVTLDSLVTDDVLSSPPEGALVIPGNATARAALGYLHANCGICHNDQSFVSAAVDVKFWLTSAHLGSVNDTPTYETAVDEEPLLGLAGADKLIARGEPEASAVVLRMQLRGDEDQMPPIASDEQDTDGIAAVSAWIEDL